MQSFLYFGKRIGFEFFESVQQNPFFNANLAKIIELDDYHIRILPKSRIYGVQFLEENEAIFVFLSIYEFSLDDMGRRGYHAFSIYFPFQSPSDKLYFNFPENIDQCLNTGLKRSLELKQNNSSDILPPNLVFSNYLSYNKRNPIKIIDQKVFVNNKSAGENRGGNLLFKILFEQSVSNRFSKYYFSYNEDVRSQIDMKTINLSAINFSYKKREGELTLEEIWWTLESDVGIAKKLEEDQLKNKSLKKIPYFILPVYYDMHAQKMDMHSKAFHHFNGEEEVSDILPENGFFKFIRDNKKNNTDDLLIHLCRAKLDSKPFAGKPCVLLTFGRFDKPTNFITIIFEEKKYELDGQIIPQLTTVVKLLEGLSAKVQNKDIKSDSDVPNFSIQFTNLRMVLYKEKKSFLGFNLGKSKDSIEPALDRIAKKSEDLQLFLQYFFLNPAVKTFTIRGYNPNPNFQGKQGMLEYIEENFEGPFHIKDFHFTDYLDKKDIETSVIGKKENKVKTQKGVNTKTSSKKEETSPKTSNGKSTKKLDHVKEKDKSKPKDKNKGKGQFWGRKSTSKNQKREKKKKEKPKIEIKSKEGKKKEIAKSNPAAEILFVAFFFAALVIGVVAFIRVVDDLRNNDYSKNIHELQEKEAIIPIVTKEEIRQLDLPKNLRDQLNEAAIYLSKIQKSSRYSSRYTKNQKYYFPDGDNRIYPYKREIINEHINRLSSIIKILEGKENVKPGTTKQLKEIDQNLRKHLEDFFPIGFSQKTFRDLKIPESKINENFSTNGSGTKSVYKVADDYGISPWTLLLDFNKKDIKVNPDGLVDDNGDPIVEFDFNDQDDKEGYLLVYIRR